MLYRKFANRIEEFLKNEPKKIMLINGARQIGKSYLIRYVGKKMFKNFIEINLKEDRESIGIFETVRSTADFYLQLGTIAGNKLGSKENTGSPAKACVSLKSITFVFLNIKVI